MSNRLIDAKLVRGRLSTPDDDGVNAAIESAIDAALPKLKSVLDTEFDLGSRSDLFYIDRDLYMPHGGLYCLRASMGFLVASTVVMSVGYSLEEVQSTAPSLKPSIILAEKGMVKVSSEHAGMYIRLDYDHGLDEDDDTPDWLVEVMITYTSKVLSAQQVGDGKPVLTEMYKFIEQHGGGILDTHLRTGTDAIPALN